jgi:GT2 family glycosyltransferase
MMFMSPVNNLIQKIKKRAAFVGGNVFIRASTLEKAGGYNKVTTFYGDEVDTSSRILPFGFIEYVPTLIVKTSARRYRDFGFWNTQKKYDASTWSTIGKRIIRQEETNHPR